MPRTRSESAHRKVLEAALALVAQRGVDATSMDAVARESGVSKATMYNHWQDKDALLLEIMAEVNGLNARPPFDSGNIRADMVAVLTYQPNERSGLRDRIMPHLVAYSAANQVFGLAWRNLVMDPPRRELRHLLQRGIAEGHLSPALDIDLSLAMLLGPVVYWHVFFKHLARRPGIDAEGVVDAYWRAFGLQPRRRTPAAKRKQAGG